MSQTRIYTAYRSEAYSRVTRITGIVHLADNYRKIVPINILISLCELGVSRPVRIINVAEILSAPPICRARRDIIIRMHAKQHRDLHPRQMVKVQMTAACILMQLRSLGLLRRAIIALSHVTLARYIR